MDSYMLEESELSYEEMEWDSIMKQMEDRLGNSWDYEETSSAYYCELK